MNLNFKNQNGIRSQSRIFNKTNSSFQSSWGLAYSSKFSWRWFSTITIKGVFCVESTNKQWVSDFYTGSKILRIHLENPWTLTSRILLISFGLNFHSVLQNPPSVKDIFPFLLFELSHRSILNIIKHLTYQDGQVPISILHSWYGERRTYEQ